MCLSKVCDLIVLFFYVYVCVNISFVITEVIYLKCVSSFGFCAY